MADTDYESGEWVGYYTYLGKVTKCLMHLTLEFGEGAIRGAGLDNPGQFVIAGYYDPESGGVQWSKQYVGKHAVRYEGSYNKGEIAGEWSMVQANSASSLRGGFRIWRLPDEL